MRLLISWFFFIFAFPVCVKAQSLRMPLYPDKKIPLSVPCSLSLKTDTSKDGKPARLKHVIEPELVFFPATASDSIKKAIMLIPGGGYGFVSFLNEGKNMAESFTSQGYDVYVLIYRLPLQACQENFSWVPLTDAMKGLKIIRQNNYRKIGVIGFSAGGHLAASLCNLSSKNPFSNPIAPPDFAALIYPVISFSEHVHVGSRNALLGADTASIQAVKLFSLENSVSEKTPPTFLIHSIDDKSVPMQNSQLYFNALMKHKVLCEQHLFPFGGHGFGVGKKARKNAPDWIPLALDFFKMVEER